MGVAHVSGNLDELLTLNQLYFQDPQLPTKNLKPTDFGWGSMVKNFRLEQFSSKNKNRKIPLQLESQNLKFCTKYKNPQQFKKIRDKLERRDLIVINNLFDEVVKRKYYSYLNVVVRKKEGVGLMDG